MFILCSGCSVLLQQAACLQKPQHPSCRGCAGTHLRNSQRNSDFFFVVVVNFDLILSPFPAIVLSDWYWMVKLSIIFISHTTLPRYPYV